MNLSVVTMSPSSAGAGALPAVPVLAGPNTAPGSFVSAVPKNVWMEPPKVVIPCLFSALPPSSGEGGGAGAPPANAGGGSGGGGPASGGLTWPEMMIVRGLLLDRFRAWLSAKDGTSGLESFRQLAEEEPAIAEHVRDIIEHKDSLERLRDAESMRQVVFNLELYARQVTAEAGRILDTGDLGETARYMQRILVGLDYLIVEVLREKINNDPPLKGLVRDGDPNHASAREFTFDDLQGSFSVFHPVAKRNYPEVVAGLVAHAGRLRELRLMRTVGDQARGIIANAVFPWAFAGAMENAVTEIGVRPDLKFREDLNNFDVELIFSGIVRKMMGLVGGVKPPAHLSIKWDGSDGAFHIESDAANLSADIAQWTAGFHRAVDGKNYYDGNGGLPLVRDLAQKIGWKIELNVDKSGVRFKLTPAQGDVLLMDDDEAVVQRGPDIASLDSSERDHLQAIFVETAIGALGGDIDAKGRLEGMRGDIFLGPVARGVLDNFDLFKGFLLAPDLDAFGRASQAYLGYMAGGFFDRLGGDGVDSAVKFVRGIGRTQIHLIDQMFERRFPRDGPLGGELDVAQHDFVERLGSFFFAFAVINYARPVAGRVPQLSAMRDEGRNPMDARGWAIKTLFPYAVFGATKGNEVEVKIEIPRGLNFTAGLSADQMGFALAELVYNATKYSDKKKTERWVRVSYEDGSLVVEDNGIGIGEKFQERIFELGFRVEGREAIDGQGIGLASVRSRFSKMGLDIRAESKEGEGTRFIISKADGPILV